MTWIVGAETSGATDIMLLFYEPAEYKKFAFNSLFKYRCVCFSVYFFFLIGLAVDKLETILPTQVFSGLLGGISVIRCCIYPSNICSSL